MQKRKNEKPDNYIYFEFEPVGTNEALARSVAAAFILPVKPSIETISDVRTAVSEAVTNAIIHGYRDMKGRVEMECELYGKILNVRVTDHGCGIENIEEAMQPFFTSCGDGERSGMGFAVMSAFMDELKVESCVGKGTTVIMKKNLEEH